MIGDHLVCGIRNTKIQQKLLSEGSTLTLTKAIEITIAMESKHLMEIPRHLENRAGETNVHKVGKKAEPIRQNLSRFNVFPVEEAIFIRHSRSKIRNVSFVITKDILPGNVERKSCKVENEK